MNSIRYQKIWLKSLQIESQVIHYGATHFHLWIGCDPDLIAKQIATDLQDSNITMHELMTHPVVLDFRSEGHSDKDIAVLIQCLRDRGIKNFCVVFNACVDVQSLDYPAIVVPTHLANSYDWFTNSKHLPIDLATESKFLCLMRSPTVTRAKFAGKLLELGVDLRLSFGAMYDQPIHLTQFNRYFPNGTQLPLILDQLLIRTPRHAPDHDISHDLLRRCAVNIVVESSSQHEPNTWTSKFITEKTFKCFAMGQIPIWWAVPGLVAEVRALGFDVFDDIVNHSYDGIESETPRMKQVLQQISRLQGLDLAKLRRDNYARLQSNWQHLAALVENGRTSYHEKLKEIGYA